MTASLPEWYHRMYDDDDVPQLDIEDITPDVPTCRREVVSLINWRIAASIMVDRDCLRTHCLRVDDEEDLTIPADGVVLPFAAGCDREGLLEVRDWLAEQDYAYRLYSVVEVSEYLYRREYRARIVVCCMSPVASVYTALRWAGRSG